MKRQRNKKQIYEDFRGYKAGKQVKKEFDWDDGLIELADCDQIGYISDKWKGKTKHTYAHDFNKPYPKLYCNMAGDTLVIKGKKGQIQVLKEGLTG